MKFWTYVQIGLPYLPSSMDKIKFGQVLLLCALPAYPKSLDIFQLKIVLMNIFLQLLGFYWLIIKLNIIRDSFKWRISLGMTWNIKKSLQNYKKKIPSIT